MTPKYIIYLVNIIEIFRFRYNLISPVMVNFMCQLAWASGWPDIWSNIILGVSLRVFLDKINI